MNFIATSKLIIVCAIIFAAICVFVITNKIQFSFKHGLILLTSGKEPIKSEWQHSIPSSPTSISKCFNLSNIGYVHNPVRQCNKSEPLLLIAVIISSPENHRRRNDLRDTWTKPLVKSSKSALVFLVGQSKNPIINAKVIIEANRTRDIVIVDFAESYRNLSLKTILMLRWVKDYCSNARFILKVDDDMFINSFHLLNFVASEKANDGIIYGRLAKYWPPIRNNFSKWMVTQEEYSYSTYPDFVTGPAYLIGTKSLTKLFNVCTVIPYLHLEDVFVTGICSEVSEIPRQDHSNFKNMPISNESCQLLTDISYHEVRGDLLKTLWKLILNSNTYKMCDVKKPKL